MLIYIHGFNSSPASRTCGLLREAFDCVTPLAYSCAAPFGENLALLMVQLRYASMGQRGKPVIVGSSLGGFYASQLAAKTSLPCVLLNPVVFPAQVLQMFLGKNTYMHSGIEWTFTQEICNSYTQFADTRAYDIPRFIVVGLRDSLLDSAATLTYWQNHARIHTTNDEHSLACLDTPTQNAIRALQRFGCFA